MPSRAERKLWRSLRRRKGREESGLFLAEGPNLLEELLRSPAGVEAVLHDPAAPRDEPTARLLQEAAARGWRVEEVERRTLEEIADTATPRGVLAVARIPDRGWPSIGARSVLLLDGVQDPGNVGTLVRTAEALGIGGVVGLEGTADPWSPKTVRAAAGSGLRVPTFRTGTGEAVAEVRRRGLPLWIADAGGEPLERGDPAPHPLAVGLGSEARGASATLRAAADRVVAVAMRGRVESLNVAAAGAILLDRILAVGERPAGTSEGRGGG